MKSQVLLLEAGQEEPIAADIPGLVYQLEGTNLDWDYRTQSENSSCLKDKECTINRGKVIFF